MIREKVQDIILKAYGDNLIDTGEYQYPLSEEVITAILQAIRDEVEGVKTLTAHTSGSFATGWQAGFNYCRSQIEEKLK
jgi:hypothetical protein